MNHFIGRWWLAGGMLALLAVFFVDISRPLGVQIGYAYVVIAITAFFASARDAMILATLATIANVVAYCFAPIVEAPEYIVASNRAASVFTTWLLIVTGFLFHRQTKAVIATIAENNERRRLALEGAELGFWDQDLNTGEIIFDESWLATLGYGPSEIVQTSNWYLDLVHPDDRSMTQSRWEDHLAGRSPRFEAEQRLRTRSGAWRQVVTKGRVIAKDEYGNPVRAAGTHLDVTEAREMQARAERAQRDRLRELRLITDAIPMMIGYIDREEKFQFYNAAYEQAHRVSDHQIKGKRFREIVGDEAYRRLHPQIVSALGGKRVQFEEPVFQAEGVRWWLFQFLPRTDEQGEVLGFYSLVTDITGLKRSQEEIDRQREALALYSRRSAANEMAATLAHEINQPLGTISVYSGRLLQLLKEDKAKQTDLIHGMARIKDSASRAGQVVEKARAMVDDLPLQLALVEPIQLLDTVRKICSARAAAAQATIHLEVAPDAPPIYADFVQMQQVLTNLVVNSIDATEGLQPSRKRIIVAVSSTDDRSEITVVDRGRGLPESHLEHVFEPHFTTKTDGLGIGLNICRSIVATHGGKLWAAPNEGDGVTFYVSLPPAPPRARTAGIAENFAVT